MRERFPAGKAPVFSRGNASRALREEIARLLADSGQPVRALIDDTAVRDNAYGANPDAGELSFFMWVYEWLVETEAGAAV